MDLKSQLCERLIRYAKMDSQVNSSKAGIICPTNPQELELAKMLADELKKIGLETYSDEKGFTIALLKGNTPSISPIALIAHIDTAEGFAASSVQPQVHTDYDGRIIQLKNGITLDPSEDTALTQHLGDTLITSDGTTLLGSDDKAGIAAIITAVEYLKNNPSIKHGDIEVVFTPDEEGGDGMSNFPLEQLKSKIAYTIDGNAIGEIECECYNAYMVSLLFTGVAIHPGHARGRMVNAISMATSLINLLPRSESPEATDGYYGCYWPDSLSATISEATLQIAVRDHDKGQVERKIEAIKRFVAATEAAFPGGKILMSIKESYLNMKEGIDRNPEVMDRLMAAMGRAKVEPIIAPIRGGTDGSKLTAMGIPCPNIFTGNHNGHGPREWVSLNSLEKSCLVAIELAKGL